MNNMENWGLDLLNRNKQLTFITILAFRYFLFFVKEKSSTLFFLGTFNAPYRKSHSFRMRISGNQFEGIYKASVIST